MDLDHRLIDIKLFQIDFYKYYLIFHYNLYKNKTLLDGMYILNLYSDA